MLKNILILSSNYTGHGHKSITESLCEQFSSNYPDVRVHVLDGFTLGGDMGMRIGKMYGSVTRNAKEIWRMLWEISMKRPSIFNEFTELSIRDKFIKYLKKVKPDLILSVHPNFNGSVINILEDYNLKMPFVTLLADLVSISPLWTDPRADYIICPTTESKYKCLEFGVSESRLKVIGFPVRARFTAHIGKTGDNDYHSDKALQCLIMSGGEGVGNMNRIAQILLDNFDCIVRIIAGRNAVLKRRLEVSLKEKYGDNVEVYGFMENVQDLMLASDIAFTRGSPNVAMEAVSCNVPLVITGALPGQEEGNPGYIQKYDLGVVCNDLGKLKSLVSSLLANNAERLNQIKHSQREFTNPNVAKEIVDFIMSLNKKGEIDFDAVEITSLLKDLNDELGRARLRFLRRSLKLQKRVLGKRTLIRPRTKLRRRS